MAADPQKAAETLLQNPQFMQLFEKVLSGDSEKDGGLLAGMPKEGDPKREEWLKELQEKLHKESMKNMKAEMEQVQTDSSGQWMYVLPTAGFCIKCKAAGGAKIFINIAQHEKIAEPAPMPPEKNEAGEEETRFRVPLSCAAARPGKDKSGKPCKIYDVIVNPSTIARTTEDHEFRRFVAALCMQWIQQKYEPTLNVDEFGNLNFKVKGTLEPQRIRLSATPKAPNAMGDEIKLPSASAAGTAPSNVGGASGTGKLIEELSQVDKKSLPAASQNTVQLASEAADPSSSPPQKPKVLQVTKEGTYDWSKHARPTQNPLFKESVPAQYLVDLHIPTVQTIKEVNVHMTNKKIECYYVDEEIDTSEPFITVIFDYPVNSEPSEAKFMRKKSLLRLRVTVELHDETLPPQTKPSRDAMEEEDEEKRAREERRNAELKESKEKADRIRKADEQVMKERKEYVENLSALQSGDIPPVVKEDIDKMEKDQLLIMLARLENNVRKGDSLDVMLEKLPAEVLQGICGYIRDKLSLEPAKPKTREEAPPAAAAPSAAATTTKTAAAEEDDDSRTFNYAKRAMKLFGVEFQNRYLFALDS